MGEQAAEPDGPAVPDGATVPDAVEPPGEDVTVEDVTGEPEAATDAPADVAPDAADGSGDAPEAGADAPADPVTADAETTGTTDGEGAEDGRAEPAAEPDGAEPDGAEPAAEPDGAEPDGAEPAAAAEDEPAEAEQAEDEPAAAEVVEGAADEPAVEDPAVEHPANGATDGGPGGEDDRQVEAAADAARRRLLSALVPRFSRAQLLAGGVCALLGFAVVVQARQAEVASLSSLRQSDLITVLDNATQETARLDAQAADLQRTLARLQSSTDGAPAARQAAQSRLDTLGVLAGTLPATGPGIELEISDPKAAVNATDLLETIQELRDAGAEAMQLGSVRVVARTALLDDSASSGLLVDRTVLTPPYRLLAIGDPQTLAAALQIPGGVLEALRNKGGEGTVRTLPAVSVAAVVTQRPPQYARPAPAGGS